MTIFQQIIKKKADCFLLEMKVSKATGISKSLFYYKKITKAPHAFQVALDMDYVEGNCFSFHEPIIVPAKNFLSQLI